MPATLKISSGRFSAAGVKDSNDDACGIRLPAAALLNTKGAAAVIADGMSGSEAGREAAEACVSGFLSDYFSTPETWSTETAGGKVLSALNRWLYAQGHQHFESTSAMVTTLSVLVIKSATAHLFHVGDTRIYRMRKGRLERLTRDHRLHVSADKNYLSRAMGIELHMKIDYRALPVEVEDVYLLTTDGIHDFVDDAKLAQFLYTGGQGLDEIAAAIAGQALANGSHDNVSCGLLKVEALPHLDEREFYQRFSALPFPPPLEAGMVLDGYEILRELHASKRTQIYLALERETRTRVILKTPSVNYDDDPEYIDRFLHEEWAGRRIRNPHVLQVLKPHARRQCLYYITEFIEGQTLRRWMNDNPQPALAEVRDIVQQIAAGLRAFHRQEMIHQDLKPENIMIDDHGTVKIIDFGSTKIAGIEEITTPLQRQNVLGTRNYTAPEYLQGISGSNASDIYSLGVIAYEMLTGKLPYGGRELTLRRLQRVHYTPGGQHNPEIPVWLDKALEKAVAIERRRRYTVLSEFTHDLAHPNPAFVAKGTEPLIERNPLLVWKGIAGLLFILNLVLLYLL
ncbi:MAG: bifunctional protein-serine/threonine kinase/phosphatase [Gammaproteobacteria bacterium]|jgi:serine/threonine protein phosphatase PrpC